jgi:hypothetical protein
MRVGFRPTTLSTTSRSKESGGLHNAVVLRFLLLARSFPVCVKGVYGRVCEKQHQICKQVKTQGLWPYPGKKVLEECVQRCL